MQRHRRVRLEQAVRSLLAPAGIELGGARLGWRVGPHTARYVAARVEREGARAFPVIVADARTGLPLRQTLRADEVREEGAEGQGRLF
jgi:hypothetical protein